MPKDPHPRRGTWTNLGRGRTRGGGCVLSGWRLGGGGCLGGGDLEENVR